MDLSDQQTADSAVRHVELGGTLAQFAASHGCGRQTVTRQLRRLPDLKRRLDAARHSAQTVAHHAPRMLPRVEVVTPEVVSGLDGPDIEGPDYYNTPRVSQVDREELLGLLLTHARDPDSRGCSKALGILGEICFAPELLRMRSEAKRLEQASETDGKNKPLIVRVPASLPPAPTVD